jgi:hypothetical protein
VIISTGRCFSAASARIAAAARCRHVGHVPVRDDEVEVTGLELLQRDHAVLGLIDVGEAEFLEQIAHDAAHGREVVDNEKFHLGI